MRHLQTNHSMIMLSKTIPGKCQPGESFFNFTSKLKNDFPGEIDLSGI